MIPPCQIDILATLEGQRTGVLDFWTVFEFIFIIAEYRQGHSICATDGFAKVGTYYYDASLVKVAHIFAVV